MKNKTLKIKTKNQQRNNNLGFALLFIIFINEKLIN
jgi:hypothetical protein